MKKLRFSLAAVLATVLVLSVSSCSPGKMDVSNVTAIIDTRPKAVYDKSHIVSAINIDYSSQDFLAFTTPLPRNGKYLLYGTNDAEVIAAINLMLNRGFPDVTNIGDFKSAQEILPLGVTPTK